MGRFLLEACMPRVATVHGAAPEVAARPSDRPRAFPIARVEAAEGVSVTSAYHHTARLQDRWGREILTRADGRRTEAQLRDELDAVAASASVSDAEQWRSIRAELPQVLGRFLRQGLIVG